MTWEYTNLIGDTLVTTDSGSVCIEELHVNSTIEGDEGKVKVTKKVEKKCEMNEYHITTNHHKVHLVCSPTTEVFTPFGWTPMYELSEGMDVMYRGMVVTIKDVKKVWYGEYASISIKTDTDGFYANGLLIK